MPPTIRKTGVFVIAVIAMLTAAVVVLGLPFVAWTPIRFNSKTIYVDIRGGRIRTETYLCWIMLSESVTDSAVTRSLAATGEALPAAEWRTALRFPIGGSISPNFAFGGALIGMLKIEEALRAANHSPSAQRSICEKFLRLLQENQSAHAAREYAEGVWRAALERRG